MCSISEVKRVCGSSKKDHVTIPMSCPHQLYVDVLSVTYIKGDDPDLCLKDSLGSLKDACQIKRLTHIVKTFNKRCNCQETCTRTTFISQNQKNACKNTAGHHNIHVLYTCKNATSKSNNK